MKIVIGSRGSKLALAQSEFVKAKLMEADPSAHVEIKIISTKGDRILDKPLNQIGDKGLFTMEIEAELLRGEIDLAVHSLKDLPSEICDPFVLASTLACEDAHDCVVLKPGFHSLNELPEGATVATGSPRRKAQLLSLRPDLHVVGIRGNVETRLRKFEELNYDGIVLAAAGLRRLGLGDRITQVLSDELMVPACGQGVLALEVRKDSSVLKLIEKIADPHATKRLLLERAYLDEAGGSCHLPIGAHAQITEEGILFHALYGTEEGQIVRCASWLDEGNEVEQVRKIARQLKNEVHHG